MMDLSVPQSWDVPQPTLGEQAETLVSTFLGSLASVTRPISDSFRGIYGSLMRAESDHNPHVWNRFEWQVDPSREDIEGNHVHLSILDEVIGRSDGYEWDKRTHRYLSEADRRYVAEDIEAENGTTTLRSVKYDIDLPPKKFNNGPPKKWRRDENQDARGGGRGSNVGHLTKRSRRRPRRT